MDAVNYLSHMNNDSYNNYNTNNNYYDLNVGGRSVTAQNYYTPYNNNNCLYITKSLAAPNPQTPNLVLVASHPTLGNTYQTTHDYNHYPFNNTFLEQTQIPINNTISAVETQFIPNGYNQDDSKQQQNIKKLPTVSTITKSSHNKSNVHEQA
ncbi:unnamed protein product, partial [Didymodactylos carnosus]